MRVAPLALLFACAGASAHGEPVPSVRPGDTVRVYAESDAVLRLRPESRGAEPRLIMSRAPVVGRVVEADAQRLVVAVPDEEARLEIALDDVRLLQRSDGRKRSVLRSTLTGLAIGAAVGAVLGLTTDGGCVGERGDGATLTCIGLGAAVVAPAGALIGALAAPEREQWRDVPLPTGPTLALRLSWSF